MKAEIRASGGLVPLTSHGLEDDLLENDFGLESLEGFGCSL